MDQQDNHNQAVEAKRRKDRGKLAFLAIVAIAVLLVYMSQQSGTELLDWPGDLPAALAQAKKEDRKVLVFFAGRPPSRNARKMSTKTLAKNRKYIKDGKFITVLVKVKKTDDLAKKYGISMFPTFLLLDARGKELNRRDGFVDEVAFRDGFLKCKTLLTP